MSFKNYRGLRIGARLVSGVPTCFDKLSFYQPIYEINNNAGGVNNEAMNVRLPHRCGIFDLGNHTLLNVSGNKVYSRMQKLFTGNIYNCGYNKTMDTLLLNNEGFVIDKPTIANINSDFSIMCNKNTAPIIREYLESDQDINVESTADDYDLFAFQGSWSQAGINKLYYFLKLDFKKSINKINKCVKQKNITILNKNITGTEGFVVSIPKTETNILFDKLLHQPNIYMSGDDALKVNKMESRLVIDEHLNGKYKPYELNQLEFVSVNKGDFVGYDAVINCYRHKTSNKRIMSTSFDKYNTTKRPADIFNSKREKIGTLLNVMYSPYLKKFKGLCEINDSNATSGIYDNKKIELMNIF